MLGGARLPGHDEPDEQNLRNANCRHFHLRCGPSLHCGRPSILPFALIGCHCDPAASNREIRHIPQLLPIRRAIDDGRQALSP